MAEKKTKNQSLAELKNSTNDFSEKSSLMVYGTSNKIEKEADAIKNIVRSTVNLTTAKYGEKLNGDVIAYFNEINFSKAFSEALKDGKKDSKNHRDPENAFKDFMENENGGIADIICASDGDRILTYKNYEAIHNNIPECAQALDIYKNNIISADDFTKTIFNYMYNDSDKDLKGKIEKELDKISEKYHFEDVSDQIITDALLYGDSYVAVLSLEKELNRMLTDPHFNTTLNEESMRMIDPSVVSATLNESDIDFDTNGTILEAFNEAYIKENESDITSDELSSIIASLVNENVKVCSKREMLLERYEADICLHEDGYNPVPYSRNSKKEKGKPDTKPMYVNGSVVKVLDPSKVIELKVDNICYGYYVFEEDKELPNSYGPGNGKEVGPNSQMATSSIYSPSVSASKITHDIGGFSSSGIGDAKMELITRVFLNTLSKKFNKDFIRKNKDFKEFIYHLIKRDFIIKKGVKVTFLSPDEVVPFNVPAVYRKITLFAKLYLATLTNNIIINLGRSHDKRIFYVETGLDGDYAHAINRVIQDVKTKEFKMSNLSDINTVLNLSPGRFDDYFMPTVNGNRPIDIDTIQGMNADMSNEFLEFLRKSMLNGTGVTMAMIDASSDIEFARQISSINAQFIRGVIVYQKKFTEPFNKLLRLLYRNETQFVNEGEKGNDLNIDYSKIQVRFPSPATLAMTNMSEQIAIADQNAEFISNTLVQPTQDGKSENDRLKLKEMIIKDLLPGIEWEKYEKYLESAKLENKKEEIKNPPPDPMMGGGYM